MRVGFGYDVHRLKKGRELILGGVNIPYKKGLDGHSDADVMVHAVMDALLGAAALGDIGKHFPDTDDKYKGINSLKLLEKVADLVRESGFKIENVDVTLVAQKPKIAPYIEEMRKNIKDALKISLDMVSVKATTTEKLGFEGKEKGMSSYSVCLIS